MAKTKVEVIFLGNDRDLSGSLKSLNQQFGSTEQQVTSLASRGTAFGDTLSRRLTPALLLAGGAAVKSASEQEQAFGALDSVLGDHAGTVRDFGTTAADSYGLSEEQVARLGAVTAAQLKSMGFAQEEAAATTVELQQRGADLAATFGGPVEDAVGAIGALLRGERDPIEKYGVSLKQVDINAQLAKEGLSDLEGEERKLAEAQAALTLFMEQTADAAGQFGREADTTAGQTERLKARMGNLSAELGTQLLPIAESVLGTVGNLADGFSSLPDPVKSAVVQTALFGAALGPILSVGGRVVQALTPLARQIRDVGQAFSLGRSLADEFSVGAKGVAGSLTGSAGLSGALGVVGVAVAGAIAVWASFRAEQRETEAAVDALRDSLDQQTAAVTEQTTEMLAAEIANDATREALDKLGLSSRDLTAAIEGDVDALRTVNEALAEAEINGTNAAGGVDALGAAGNRVGAVLDKHAERLAIATAEARENIEATGGLTVAQQTQTTRLQRLADAQGAATDASVDHEAQLGDEEAAVDDAAGAQDTLADKIRDATSARRESLDPTFAALAAEDRLRDATDNYRRTLDDKEASGRDVEDALWDMVRAQSDLEGAEADALGTTRAAGTELDRLAGKLGLSRGETDRLSGRLSTLRSRLQAIDGTYRANVVTTYTTVRRTVNTGPGASNFGPGGIPLHTGGLVAGPHGLAPDLKPDERERILQLGEEVLTRNDPRHRDNLGRGPISTGAGPDMSETNGLLRQLIATVGAGSFGGGRMSGDAIVDELVAHQRRSGPLPLQVV